MNTEGRLFSGEEIRMRRGARINPIRQLSPEVLTRALDQFEYGDLRTAALLWDAIEERDDILASVVPKRRKAVARRTWSVIAIDDSPEAQAHKEAIEYFYNNVTASHATDLNVRGGFSTLVRQMMDAVGKRYAVHHIVWQPGPNGLKAKLWFVPLWFFECRTGSLRFLRQIGQVEGEELIENEWLITTGDGVMKACSIAYLFKNFTLKDWVIYCERHGMPGLQGKTGAAEGSEQWVAMQTAIGQLASDFACVTSLDDVIEKIDLTTNGALPYPPLVERMDRAMSAIWRGADLSTMSRGHGQSSGASVQGSETEELTIDDCQLITETLNTHLDRAVIFYQFGVDPLAYVHVDPPEQSDVRLDLEVDQFLLNAGAPLPIEETLQRYGRSIPDKGEALLTAPAGGLRLPSAINPGAPVNQPRGSGAPDPAGNERVPAEDQARFLSAARARLLQATTHLRQDLANVLRPVLEAPEGEIVRAAANARRALLGRLTTTPAERSAWEEILGAALLNGAVETNEKHRP